MAFPVLRLVLMVLSLATLGSISAFSIWGEGFLQLSPAWTARSLELVPESATALAVSLH